MRNVVWRSSAALAAFCLSPDWAAAQAVSNRADTVVTETIQDIVVTARRTTESLQRVPIAVSAIQGEALERTYAVNIQDLEGLAPNVTIGRDTAYANAAHFTIRGLTSMDPERSFEPAVGVAVDGIFLPSINGALVDMFDVERIEILRGPQGTLFGRNTVGGVVNVTRKKPDYDPTGAVEVTYGSWDTLHTRAAFNAPIIDGKLALRVALMKFDSDGWVENQVDDTQAAGDSRMGEDSFYGRLALRWDVTEDLNVVLNAQRYRDNGDAGAVWNVTRPGFALCSAMNDVSCGKLDNRKVWDNTPNINNVDHDSASVELNWSRNWGTLTAIAAHNREDSRRSLNYDGAAATVFEAIRDERQKTNSFELRYAGQPSDTLDLQFGGFLWWDRYFIRQENTLALSSQPFPRETQIRTVSRAVFGQANWEVLPDVRLTAGARYTHDKKTLERFFPMTFGLDGNPGTPTIIGGEKDSWSKFTLRLGVDWQATPTALVYGSFAQGYRAGGFNGRAGTIEAALTTYDPETANTFEIGAKLDLLDRRLRVNGALFYTDYKDLQLDNRKTIVINGISTIQEVVDNAASARIYGAELEATALLTDNTRLNASVGHLNAKYKDYLSVCTGGACGVPGTIIDYSDRKLRRTPKWQFAIGLEQTVPLRNDELVLGVDYRWSDRMFYTLDNDPVQERGSVGLLDAQATLYLLDGRLSLGVYGRNLTDEEYVEFAAVVDSLGFELGALNKPREFGARVGYKF